MPHNNKHLAVATAVSIFATSFETKAFTILAGSAIDFTDLILQWYIYRHTGKWEYHASEYGSVVHWIRKHPIPWHKRIVILWPYLLTHSFFFTLMLFYLLSLFFSPYEASIIATSHALHVILDIPTHVEPWAIRPFWPLPWFSTKFIWKSWKDITGAYHSILLATILTPLLSFVSFYDQETNLLGMSLLTPTLTALLQGSITVIIFNCSKNIFSSQLDLE